MKKITIVLVILFSLQAVAQVGTTFTADGIKYKITATTTVEVSTNPTTLAGAIVIPVTVSYDSANYSVTSIGNGAFFYCTELTSVIIPNSVSNIGNDAFRDCSRLNSITIPNSVTSIGVSAFESCLSLTSINIPNSVTNIGRYAFRSCDDLTSVTISNMVTTINEGLFVNCRNLTSVEISNSITSIGNFAFFNCSALTSIIIPNSVTSIGEWAYRDCSALTSINIPNSVTSIGDLAFSGCFSLSIVTVNWTNPLAITSSVFEGLTLSTVSLIAPENTSITYKTALVWKEFYSISEPVGLIQLGQKFTVNGINYYVRKATLPYEVAVDRNSDIVGELAIPSSVIYLENSFAVTNIGVGAFSASSGLTSVTIPNSVTSLVSYAFKNCSSLISVAIPNSVSSIGVSAFESCLSLTSITIPNSVTSIGSHVFSNCTSLTSITIPDSVTSIGGSAFESCTSLTSVTIPNSITSISSSTFAKCSGLTSVTIPPSVTSIGNFAFFNCSALTSIIIPNSVTSIGNGSFSKCSGLTSVNIPNSVTSIGYNAFQYCTSLTSVTVDWAVPLTVDRSIFNNLILSTRKLNVPVGTVTAYKAANVWKEFGTILEMPFVTQKIAVNGVNYTVTKATVPYEVAVESNSSFIGNAVIPTTVSNLENTFTVTSIANNAFKNCIGLTTVTIPNTVTEIGQIAFVNCIGLTSITVNNITPLIINSNVFEGLNLSTITLNVPTESELAYKNTAVWKEFGIILVQTFKADGINYIITKASLPYEVAVDVNIDFVGAASIPSTVSNTGNTFKVTSILSNAFINSTRLTSIVIPKSVASIGSYAFSNCTGLTLVTVDWATPLPINRNAFNLLDLSTRTLNVPTGTVTTYKSDLVWNEFNPILSLPILGQTFTSNGINYIVTKTTLPYEVAVGINTSFVGNAAIPTTVSNLENTFAVTAIANNAFENCVGLTSVTLPNSITSIGASAFANCNGLISITVNYITPLIINRNVFDSLNLTTIKLNVPAGTAVTYKSTLVWKEFSPITEPPVLGLSFKVNGINYYVTKATLPYEAELGNNQYFVGAASIPTTVSSNGNSFTVTAIANSAFLNCSGLTAVTIPNTVTYIGASAFESCRFLKAVIIPTSITSIGNDTFKDCQILTAVTIPTSVTTIGRSAFQGCLKLKSVTIPNSVTTIGDLAFYGCWSLTSVIISNAVKSIGVSVFAHCNMLTSVSLPNSVTTIGSNAFQGCTSLTSVTFPNSVTTIGELAYELCSSLTSVTIPNSVTSIGIYAFGYCFSLSSVTVNWTTPLPTYRDVFNGLSLSKATLNVPQGTEVAYKSANVWRDFGTIRELPIIEQKFAVNGINYIVTKATLPYEVAVDANTNSNSGRFTTAVQTGIAGAVTIPATVSFGVNSFSVTSIVASAFQNCTGLTSVTIPSSIRSIGGFAFSNCSGLTAVTVNGTTPIALNANVFENITLATVTLNVPAGTETAYKAATVWKEFKVETTLNTNSFSTNNALPFYPNPAQSQINFSQEINNLEVFDIAGRKIKTFQNSSNSFDVSNLVKGVYLLKGKTAEGKSSSQKMVKL